MFCFFSSVQPLTGVVHDHRHTAQDTMIHSENPLKTKANQLLPFPGCPPCPPLRPPDEYPTRTTTATTASMTRAIPYTRKTTKNNAMFQSMRDLGLGSLPDLLFAEQLDVVPAQDDDVVEQQQQQPESDDGLANADSDLQNSLFQDLEEFSNGWIEQEQKKLLAATPTPIAIKEGKKMSTGTKGELQCDESGTD